jgi:hypothetical protein
MYRKKESKGKNSQVCTEERNERKKQSSKEKERKEHSIREEKG